MCENYVIRKKYNIYEGEKITYKLVVIKVNRLHKGSRKQSPRSPTPGESATSSSEIYPNFNPSFLHTNDFPFLLSSQQLNHFQTQFSVCVFSTFNNLLNSKGS